MDKFLTVLANFYDYSSIDELLILRNECKWDERYISKLYEIYNPSFRNLSIKELILSNKILFSNKRYFIEDLRYDFIKFLSCRIVLQKSNRFVCIISKNNLLDDIKDMIECNQNLDIEIIRNRNDEILLCNGSTIKIIQDIDYCSGMSISHVFLDKRSYSEYELISIRKTLRSYPYVIKILEF